MSLNFPPPLHPALVGLQPPAAAAAPLAPIAPAARGVDAPATQATVAPAGLSFEGWSEAPGEPVVLGGRAYPGDAADPRAVADAIAGLLFEPV